MNVRTCIHARNTAIPIVEEGNDRLVLSLLVALPGKKKKKSFFPNAKHHISSGSLFMANFCYMIFEIKYRPV